MARILIIAGGARGRALAAELARGRARGADHDAQRNPGAQRSRRPAPSAGSARRIASPALRYALERVTLACWLLGNACGEPERWQPCTARGSSSFSARRSTRRCAGSSMRPPAASTRGSLAAGAELSLERTAYNEIPLRVLDADPRERSAGTRRREGGRRAARAPTRAARLAPRRCGGRAPRQLPSAPADR